MKRSLILSLLAIICLSASAEFRTADQALQLASDHDAAMAPGRSPRTFRLAATQQRPSSATPAFYVMQPEDGVGFVLVSAETETRTIIGYSETTTWSDDQPANVRYWMERYAEQIERIAAHAVQPARRAAAAYTAVSPLIGTTWNQRAPYNNLCPLLSGNRSVTGCVATATAQIMYKHRHPATGTGSHSYTWNSTTLSANFGATAYDWTHMIPNYTSSATTQQQSAVATLMYHLGVACEMDYNPNGSAAAALDMMLGLVNYFGYDPDIRCYPLEYYGEELTMAAIYTDLLAGRPVFISGRTRSDSGHAFVCEGIDAGGNLYINWGWGGSSDGYFPLTLMDPENQGVGGSASDEAYTEGITIYSHIQPNAGNSPIQQITASTAELTSAKRVAKSTPIGFTVTYFTNRGIHPASGYIYLVISDASGNIVDYEQVDNFSLNPGHYYASALSYSSAFSSLPAGQYNFGFYTAASASSTVWPVYLKDFGQLSLPIQVTSDSIFIDSDGISAPDDSFFSHSRFIVTQGTSGHWALDLNTKHFWDGSGDDDVLLRCNLFSRSASSIIGTYRYDGTNNGTPGTIAPTGLTFALGNSNSCYQYTPDIVELTFLLVPYNRLAVNYYIRANGRIYDGCDTIANNQQDWWVAVNGTNYDNASAINYRLATPMSVSELISATSSFGINVSSHIPYLIEGVISAPTYDPYTDGYVFTLRDLSNASQTVQCEEVTWLDPTSADAQTPLAAGDTLTLLSYAYMEYGGLTLYADIYSRGAASAATDLSPVAPSASSAPAEKFFRDGILYIRRSSTTYTILGEVVE